MLSVFLSPLARYLGSGMIAIGLWLWIDHRGYQRGFHDRDAEVAALNLTISNVHTAAEKARADDLAHAKAVEAQQSAITQEASRDLEQKLADARRIADDYARRLQSATPQADPGRGGAEDLPRAPDTSGSAPGAGVDPLLDDLRICSENTVKAQAWLDWWNRQGAVSR